MYHVALRNETKPKLDYSNLPVPSDTKPTPEIPTDGSVPDAPDGFMFYRIQSGDTLVSLSVKFGISQNKIRRYNNKVCFGHRLTHIIGKLLLIPIDSTANLTTEIKEQLTKIYIDDNKQTNDEKEQTFKEPDENGKYQLRKALRYHASGLDDVRADYYLGEANWNVRKALNIWHDDDKWEKKHTLMTQCGMTQDDATQLLENYNWNVFEAVRFCKNEQKKMEKIAKKLEKTKGKKTTEGGATEMQTVNTKDLKENLVSNEEEHNNMHQGSLTSGACCGN
eukprot:378475_1